MAYFSLSREKLQKLRGITLVLVHNMESELKQRVDEYIQANSVKAAPATKKKEPVKAPKAPKKTEKQPKETKDNSPKEIVETPKDAPKEKEGEAVHFIMCDHSYRHRRSILGRSKREKAALTMTS